MDTQDIKQKVLEYIRKNDYVSYVELEWLFDKLGFDYHGGYEIYSPVNDNVVFWTGWNEKAIGILNDLKSENLVTQEPAQPIIYLIDGGCMEYPLVRSNVNYKTPHWLPIVYRPLKGGM